MSDNWNTLGKKIAKNYKVHLIDLRNHGRSPHSDDFNYDVMCEDILEYLQHYNIQKPILLGHSLGGKVAMKFAFTYPEKTEKLINKCHKARTKKSYKETEKNAKMQKSKNKNILSRTRKKTKLI